MSAVVAKQGTVTRIWHPAPPHELHHLGNGVHADVLEGAPAYQLTTGEKIDL